jgi:hypothetical protein
MNIAQGAAVLCVVAALFGGDVISMFRTEQARFP